VWLTGNKQSIVDVLISFIYLLGRSGTKCAITASTYWLIFPGLDHDNCGKVSGMNDWQVNRSTRRKPATVSLCPLQIPHELTLVQTQAAAVGSRRLTARARARRCYELEFRITFCAWIRQMCPDVSVAPNPVVSSSCCCGCSVLTVYIRDRKAELDCYTPAHPHTGPGPAATPRAPLMCLR
jgi:hypothetical protein